jgi:hypothetical protein
MQISSGHLRLARKLARTSAPAVPHDYAAFVAAQRTRLAAACRSLTGNSHLADSVARELLAMVALRWRRLRRSDDAAAADTYLDRLIRREARAWRVELPREERTRPRRTLLVDGEPTPASRPLAVQAWAAARSMRTRRRAVLAAGLAMLACFGLLGPRHSTPPPDAHPIPTREPMPAGVSVLPPFTLLGGLWPRETRLPATLPVDPAQAPELAAAPVEAAVAILRQEPRPLLVVAADGTARRVDDPDVAGARLVTTSLSPDGRRAALLTPDAVRVLDLTTGRVRSIVAPQTSARTLVWRDARTVIVAGRPDRASQINVDSGVVTAIPALTGEDVAAGPVSAHPVELLGSAGSQRPSIRFWRVEPVGRPPGADGDVDDRPIFAPPWVGLWRGQAWSTVDLLARSCEPDAVPLPPAVGRATAAVAAVRTNGLVAGTLVTLDATAMDIVGFADDHTVIVNVSQAPSGSILLAWNTTNAEVRRVTTRGPWLQISLADVRPAGPAPAG